MHEQRKGAGGPSGKDWETSAVARTGLGVQTYSVLPQDTSLGWLVGHLRERVTWVWLGPGVRSQASSGSHPLGETPGGGGWTITGGWRGPQVTPRRDTAGLE